MRLNLLRFSPWKEIDLYSYLKRSTSERIRREQQMRWAEGIYKGRSFFFNFVVLIRMGSYKKFCGLNDILLAFYKKKNRRNNWFQIVHLTRRQRRDKKVVFWLIFVASPPSWFLKAASLSFACHPLFAFLYRILSLFPSLIRIISFSIVAYRLHISPVRKSQKGRKKTCTS